VAVFTQPTISDNVALMIFRDCEEGRPFVKVVEVEVYGVIFRERIEVREVHAQKILRTKGTKRGHLVYVYRPNFGRPKSKSTKGKVRPSVFESKSSFGCGTDAARSDSGSSRA